MLGGEHVAKSVCSVRDFGRIIVYVAATGETPQFDSLAFFTPKALASTDSGCRISVRTARTWSPHRSRFPNGSQPARSIP